MALVSFLSQLLTTMRLANGEVMQPLVQPIYDCFDLILSQDEMDADECECLSLQVSTYLLSFSYFLSVAQRKYAIFFWLVYQPA